MTGIPPTIIPKEIMNADKEIKKEFLKRVFTADGGPVLAYRKRGNRNKEDDCFEMQSPKAFGILQKTSV